MMDSSGDVLKTSAPTGKCLCLKAEWSLANWSVHIMAGGLTQAARLSASLRSACWHMVQAYELAQAYTLSPVPTF